MYPCNDCDMEFSTKSYASIHHQKVHQGINYNCDLCDKKFTQKRRSMISQEYCAWKYAKGLEM